jgi:protein-S-isoprenylcysteine O-methyltransferase Ste14
MTYGCIQKDKSKLRCDLTGEHPAGDAGQMVLACLFLATWAADSFFLRLTTFPNEYLPLWFRLPLGATLLGLSAYLVRSSHSILFDEERGKDCVVRKGVFKIARHPMYLGELVFYLGLLFLSLSLAAALVWVAGALFLHCISRYEERLLVARFGEEYEAYMKGVPMWLPWISNK